MWGSQYLQKTHWPRIGEQLGTLCGLAHGFLRGPLSCPRLCWHTDCFSQTSPQMQAAQTACSQWEGGSSLLSVLGQHCPPIPQAVSTGGFCFCSLPIPTSGSFQFFFFFWGCVSASCSFLFQLAVRPPRPTLYFPAAPTQ